MYSFRVASNTISLIIQEVCAAIIDEFAAEVLDCPTSPEEWQRVVDQFADLCQVYHAIGAIDVKHIRWSVLKSLERCSTIIRGSTLVPVGGCLPEWILIWCTDFQPLWAETSDRRWNDWVSPEDPLPKDDRPMPYFILGDDAFALKTWLMKPFSQHNMTDEQRIFNYRLSHNERIVENAFGILANRFQCLLSSLSQKPEMVKSIVLACVCLHKLMCMRYPGHQNSLLDQEDDKHHVIPREWRNGANMQDVDNLVGGNRTTRIVKKQRKYLNLYFNSPAGSVPWQDRMTWTTSHKLGLF